MQNRFVNRVAAGCWDSGADSCLDFLDIHCHCLGGVDDGPADMTESLELCRALVADSIGTVIATPHQLGRFSGYNQASKIRRAVSELNERLRENDIALKIAPGGDVRVDERLCRLIEEDQVLTLGDGGRYILVELPHGILIDIEPLLEDLVSMGITPIVSHPERHEGLMRNTEMLRRWLQCSAHLQVTAGSLLGYFGAGAERAGWQMLSAGWVSLVATDSHNVRGRRPCMTEAFGLIRKRLGQTAASLVCKENPRHVLKGENLAVFLNAGVENNGV